MVVILKLVGKRRYDVNSVRYTRELLVFDWSGQLTYTMDPPSLLCETAPYSTLRINSTTGFQACAFGPGRQRRSEYYRNKIHKMLVNQKCDLRKIQTPAIKNSVANISDTSCRLNIKHFFHTIISHLVI